ncbi:hypothetical protein QTP70_031829, partial [Hemibagrus guttatus]
FFRNRSQRVRMGQHTYMALSLSTGYPQGCVLSPLLYTLYTHDCTSAHHSNTIVKIADDTTVVGFISGVDETAYRNEVERLLGWCKENNLLLNTTSSKTNELIIDYRRKETDITPLYISGDCVERVADFWFLGVQIEEGLTWSTNTSELLKKAQYRLYFLRALRKNNITQRLLVFFYRCSIESILTYCIGVGFTSCSVAQRKTLQRVINMAQKIVGCLLPTLKELHSSHCIKKAQSILKETSHPGHNLFELLPSGRKRNGVGVVLKEEFVRNVLEVKRVSDRVMSLKLEIEGVMLNVVSGYAPQVGCELGEKERFWSELDEVMESIPTGERVVIGADFNGHVGEGNTGDEEVMGKFGVKERNLEGQIVVDFAKRMDMGVVNTYFQKREEHRVTYKSGGRRTQVDYILCRRGNLKEISDCKVVVGESVARQHRMVVCRMSLMACKKKRSKIEIEKKTKWWKLKKEECCEEFRQTLRQALGGQVVLPDDWETTAEVIRETGRKVMGVSPGRRKEDKETWWWNEEVQDSIQRKRLAKKKWDMERTEENRQEYKELQRRVKREVSKAKQKAYDELYTRLDTREGEKDLYRLARQRDRDGKDVQQVRVIKDRDGRVLTSEESVQRRWKEYFEELMNEENEREKRVEGVNSVEQKVDKIRKDEVRKALKRMKSGKAVGPDDIPVEVWKCLGEAAVEFLASLFNRVLESERMPEEWRSVSANL